jgi:acyl-CoA thioesterase-2
MGIQPLLDSFALEPAGPDRFIGRHADLGHEVVFGGQLLGQAIVAASAGVEGKRVKTLHTVFARAASYDAPLDITVDRMHDGRGFASSTVTMHQGDRLCVRAIALLSSDEPDLIRHGEPAPVVPGPEESQGGYTHIEGWDVRIVGGPDIKDPDAVGPAELDVWSRFPEAPDDQVTSQALIAFGTDLFLIATAMRPHPGVGQALAHVTLSTGVIGHTLTFHEPVNAADWLLHAHRSPYAGHGRCYGRADVFDPDGAIVASFVQDAMIRARSSGPGKL